MVRTQKHARGHKFDFHMCGTCGQLLFLTEKRQLLHFFSLRVPTFLFVTIMLSLLIGDNRWLTFHLESKGSRELNVFGFAVVCFGVFISQLLLFRFEEIDQMKPDS